MKEGGLLSQAVFTAVKGVRREEKGRRVHPERRLGSESQGHASGLLMTAGVDEDSLYSAIQCSLLH